MQRLQQNDRVLTYEDFETMDSGGYISQNQMQFRCPKSNYVSETSAFNIKTQYVTKKFKSLYSKGQVGSNGTVTPHEI